MPGQLVEAERRGGPDQPAFDADWSALRVEFSAGAENSTSPAHEPDLTRDCPVSGPCGSISVEMDAPAPDRELVRAYAREGSECAFRSLVSRHVDLVYAAAFRQLGDPGLAEETTQNVFVALARKAPRLVGHETLAGWLHRTAILEAKARIRSELRRRRREDTAISLETIQPSAPSSEPDLSPLLDEALLNLRRTDREALVLRYLEDRSLRDVGAALGVAEDAARKRVDRALERVSAFFRVRGFEVPAAGGAAVLTRAGVQAAPVGLAASSSAAGLATATGAATGFQLVVLQLMSLTKTQVVAVVTLAVALPLAWQERSLAALRTEDRRLALQETAVLARIAEREAEEAGIRSAIQRATATAAEAETRADALESRLAQRPPAKAYQWSDASPVARFPKEFLRQIPFTGVEDLRGRLSPVVTTALQFTDAETAAVQGAIDRFRQRYDAAVEGAFRSVEPTEGERRGKPDGTVRAYEVAGIETQVLRDRDELLAELRSILDAERAEILTRSLGSWVPLEDSPMGISSGRGIFPSDHRLWFAPNPDSNPDDPSLRWGVSQEGRFSFNAFIPVRDIPSSFRDDLRDWIESASTRPAGNRIDSPTESSVPGEPANPTPTE